MDDLETARRFFVEGLRLLEANDFQAAEIQFIRCLKLIPDRVSTLNNLSVVQIKLNKFAEAEAFARKAATLDEKSPEAWLNLGIALNATARREEALQAYDRAIHCNPAYAMAWLNKAMTLLELDRYDEALLACDQAQTLDSSQSEILYVKSLILKELQRPDEAQMIYRKSLNARVDSSPLFIAARRASQKADVLVINQNPNLDASLTSFQALQRPNYPGQLVDHLNEGFHFTYVFCGDVTRSRKQIPPPDFVINNVANGELVLTGGNLSDLTALFDGFGVPVVNHPSKVIKTTRDVSAKLLEDISGVVVPKTMRFSSIGKTHEELMNEIEGHYNYPLITRTLASQEGKGMTKVDSRTALMEVLSSGFPDKFFVTEFVASKGENKFYRKIRAAAVRGEITIVRVDYDSNWNVHGRKSNERVAFYRNNIQLLDDEKNICARPENRLGRPAIRALRAICDRIPLDVFGVDFDVDTGGALVFYEANATMNLFSTAREEVAHPKNADDCLKWAFQRYFMTLVGRR